MKTIFRTKRTIALILSAVFLAGSVNLFAQTPRVLSLEEAIELSIQNSKQLKLGQSNVDIAGLQIKQIRDNQLPSLSLSGSYLRLNTPNINMKARQSEGDSVSSGGFGKVNQAMYGMVSASVPIFTGFRFKYGLESAKYLEQASRLDVENDRMAVIQNTVAAYGNLYKSQRAVDLGAEQLRSEQKRVAEFTNREKNGMLARNDLMKAKLQASQVELALLDAENDLKLTTVNMNLLLGLPEVTPLAVDSASFSQLQDAGTLSQWEEKAMTNRKDLAANLIRQKAANANIKVAKADLYPNVALTGGYIALGIPGVITVPNAMNVGIGVKYDIASLWKSGAKIAEARTREFQVQTNQEMLYDKVRMEINTAYYNYVLSKRRIEVLATAVEQADENFRITKNKYENSLVSTTDLLDADVDQIRSKINFESAKADAIVAYKRLEQVSGILN